MILPDPSLRLPRAEHPDVPRACWAEADLRLDELEGRLRGALAVCASLEEAGRYHLAAGGKRMRGRMVLACGLALGVDAAALLPAAAAVELLHQASLVHDDLQDGDRRRRGADAVWARYGRDTALLLGDTLIAAAFAEAAASPQGSASALARHMARCVGALAEGQRRDTVPAPAAEWSPAAYEWVARRKTGRLFGLAAEAALTVAGAPAATRGAARRSLEWSGVGFQILDDLADLFGAKGRAPGSDLRAGRMSDVVVHYLRVADSRDAARLRATMADGGSGPGEPRAALVERLRASEAVASTLEHQRAVLRRARRAAAPLPTSLRETLEDVARTVAERTRTLAQRTTLRRERSSLDALLG